MVAGGWLWLDEGSSDAKFSSLMECSFEVLPTARREPCRRDDAGFSRIPDWRRLCMGFYFSSSWMDSPLEIVL
jgi:hypothetical protein